MATALRPIGSGTVGLKPDLQLRLASHRHGARFALELRPFVDNRSRRGPRMPQPLPAIATAGHAS